MKVSGKIEVCCHQIEWYDIGRMKKTPILLQVLEAEAESRAQDCISENCGRGELNCLWRGEKEIRGWFNIEGW